MAGFPQIVSNSPNPGSTAWPQVNGGLAAVGAPGWQLNASVATNNLTVSLLNNVGNNPSANSPVIVGFRDTTLANGDPVFLACATSLSFTVNSTNTMGAANNVPFRLWVVLFNNAGSPVLGLINCVVGAATPTQIFPLAEHTLQSATGGNGGSTAGTFYAASSITTKAFRILGYLEWASGLATAGTWSSAPTIVQLFGPGIKKPADVVQKVFSFSAFAATSNSSTVAIATNVTASITPTSAANLIGVRIGGTLATLTSGNSAIMQIRRGTSPAISPNVALFSNSGQLIAPIELDGLDAPGTTSSTSYTAYLANSNNTNPVSFPNNQGGNTAFIIIEELMG